MGEPCFIFRGRSFLPVYILPTKALLLCAARYMSLAHVAAAPVYEYSCPSEEEDCQIRLGLGGALQLLLLLLLLLLLMLVPMPLLLLLLLLLRFGVRCAGDGVVL